MAVTLTNDSTFSLGPKRCVYGLVTLDAVTSGAVNTGLEVIDGGSVTPASTTTSTLRYQINFNKSSAGAAANGYLQITTGTAGDNFNVFLFGR